METRAHHILIGLFTLASVGAALLISLWFSDTGLTQNYRQYDILFREPVAGLSVGSAVQFSGIRVGEVERLALDPDDPSRVRARVRINSSAPITEDTRARLALVNITGAYSIELSQGDPDNPPLTPEDGEVPTIEAEPSSLAQLRLNGEELLVRFNNLMENANRVLSEDNAAHLANTLANLDRVSAALAGQRGRLREGLDGLVEAGNRLNELLARVDEDLVGESEPLLSSAAETMNNIERFSQQLNGLLSDNRQSLQQGLQSAAQLEPAVRDLRRVLSNLEAITARFEEDPANFLLGRDNIREYQP